MVVGGGCATSFPRARQGRTHVAFVYDLGRGKSLGRGGP